MTAIRAVARRRLCVLIRRKRRVAYETAQSRAGGSPAIERAYASAKAAVVHVCIDPKANSEEMPTYDEFRTWYDEGAQ
ncbi:MAG TPA: hypothetical protein VJ777_13065 [Mycobacterium sp.]|nr:hypothetical protein [Mycobacterium sp.]